MSGIRPSTEQTGQSARYPRTSFRSYRRRGVAPARYIRQHQQSKRDTGVGRILAALRFAVAYRRGGGSARHTGPSTEHTGQSALGASSPYFVSKVADRCVGSSRIRSSKEQTGQWGWGRPRALRFAVRQVEGHRPAATAVPRTITHESLVLLIRHNVDVDTWLHVRCPYMISGFQPWCPRHSLVAIVAIPISGTERQRRQKRSTPSASGYGFIPHYQVPPVSA